MLEQVYESMRLTSEQQRQYEVMSEIISGTLTTLLEEVGQTDRDQAFDTLHLNATSQNAMPEIAVPQLFAKYFLRAGSLDKLPKTVINILRNFASQNPPPPEKKKEELAQVPPPTLRTRVVPAPRPHQQQSSSAVTTTPAPNRQQVFDQHHQ